MYEYNLPQSVTTTLSGYNILTHFYKSVYSQEDKEVQLNFNACSQFDANLAAALGAILDNLAEKGYQLWFVNLISRSVKKSLSRNGFFQAWEIDTGVQEKENVISYKKFDSGSDRSFKEYIDSELMQKQKFPSHSELAGEKILESIYEIYANAVSHGETKYVYSCGEYKEMTCVLDMTIVDCGVTIPMKVNDFFRKKNLPEMSASYAVSWAFRSGNTTKEETGGLGLAILKEFIQLNAGELQMVSDNVLLEFKGNEVKSFLLDIPFPGTIVNMRFNFNDSNNYCMTSELEPIDMENLL